MVKTIQNTFVSLTILVLSGCVNTVDHGLFKKEKISEVYVADFKSNNQEFCKVTDVNLTHYQAGYFFQIAKAVDSKTRHDHYDLAPCYIEGTLLYNNAQTCEWDIHAGGTGSIQCGEELQYYVCDSDSCQSLFP